MANEFLRPGVTTVPSLCVCFKRHRLKHNHIISVLCITPLASGEKCPESAAQKASSSIAWRLNLGKCVPHSLFWPAVHSLIHSFIHPLFIHLLCTLNFYPSAWDHQLNMQNTLT